MNFSDNIAKPLSIFLKSHPFVKEDLEKHDFVPDPKVSGLEKCLSKILNLDVAKEICKHLGDGVFFPKGVLVPKIWKDGDNLDSYENEFFLRKGKRWMQMDAGVYLFGIYSKKPLTIFSNGLTIFFSQTNIKRGDCFFYQAPCPLSPTMSFYTEISFSEECDQVYWRRKKSEVDDLSLVFVFYPKLFGEEDGLAIRGHLGPFCKECATPEMKEAFNKIIGPIE